MIGDEFMLAIKQMYLIHDWLYEDLEQAKTYDDGKDSPELKFVLLHKEDTNRTEIYAAEPGVFIFNTLEEAQTEKVESEK